MKNELDVKYQSFKDIFEVVKSCKNLEELKEEYTLFESKREEIWEYIVKNTTTDEERSQYLTEFANYELDLWVDGDTKTLIGNVPSFDDDVYFEDIEKMFDDYGSYFQRYGCLSPEQVVSWDKENVMLVDEMGNVEIVKRPDVIVNGL
jgi:hypothetical protein